MTRLQKTRLGLWVLTAGVLGVLSTPSLAAPTMTADPLTVIIPNNETQGTATITWDAGGGLKSLGATVYQQIDGGDETKFSGKAKGSQTVSIGVGQTRTFKLYNALKKVLATVVVTGKRAGAADDAANEDAANGGVPAPPPAADDAPDDPAAAPFTGTWPTIAGGTHEYTVILKQVGNKVTGTYSPGNGKIFDGVVVGNKVTFKWTQDGGYEGTGEFTLDENGKGFKGSSTALKPQQFTNTWNSFVPEPISLAGTWETVFNNAPLILTLQQTGDKVTGTYTPGNGKVEGTLTDNILRFKWTSDSGKGSGRFVFAKSEMAFSGSYSNGDDPDEADGIWNGTRKVGGGGGKNVAASFAGVWKVTAKFGFTLEFHLAQDGNQVSGLFLIYNVVGQHQIKEATVVGNTLRWKSVRQGSEKDVGEHFSGEFVMDAGGKSFKGKLESNDGKADNGLTGIFLKEWK